MPDVAVIDAGIALACFLDPPGARREYALSVLKAYQVNHLRFIVPDIFFVEVPYSLMKAHSKERISDAAMAQAARFIDVMTTDVVPTSFSVAAAIGRAEQWELKSYDATYFDLAAQMDVPLAAIDIDLLKKARKFNLPIWRA